MLGLLGKSEKSASPEMLGLRGELLGAAAVSAGRVPAFAFAGPAGAGAWQAEPKMTAIKTAVAEK
jgi:hypothetical protein